jgi:hypothetical protein
VVDVDDQGVGSLLARLKYAERNALLTPLDMDLFWLSYYINRAESGDGLPGWEQEAEKLLRRVPVLWSPVENRPLGQPRLHQRYGVNDQGQVEELPRTQSDSGDSQPPAEPHRYDRLPMQNMSPEDREQVVEEKLDRQVRGMKLNKSGTREIPLESAFSIGGSSVELQSSMTDQRRAEVVNEVLGRGGFAPGTVALSAESMAAAEDVADSDLAAGKKAHAAALAQLSRTIKGGGVRWRLQSEANALWRLLQQNRKPPDALLATVRSLTASLKAFS